MQVSGAQFHNTSPVHCTVCSPPKQALIHPHQPPKTVLSLPHPAEGGVLLNLTKIKIILCMALKLWN